MLYSWEVKVTTKDKLYISDDNGETRTARIFEYVAVTDSKLVVWSAYHAMFEEFWRKHCRTDWNEVMAMIVGLSL